MRRIQIGDCIMSRNNEEQFQILEILEEQGFIWGSGHRPTEWVPYNKAYLVICDDGKLRAGSEKTNALYIEDLLNEPDVMLQPEQLMTFL